MMIIRYGIPSLDNIIFLFFYHYMANILYIFNSDDHFTGGGKLSGNSADFAANLAYTIDPSMFFN